MSLTIPKTEEETLRFWKEIDAFRTQLRLNQGHEQTIGNLSMMLRLVKV